MCIEFKQVFLQVYMTFLSNPLILSSKPKNWDLDKVFEYFASSNSNSSHLKRCFQYVMSYRSKSLQGIKTLLPLNYLHYLHVRKYTRTSHNIWCPLQQFPKTRFSCCLKKYNELIRITKRLKHHELEKIEPVTSDINAGGTFFSVFKSYKGVGWF